MPPTMKAAATALMVRNVFQVKVGGFRQLPGRIQESRGKNLPLESEQAASTKDNQPAARPL